MSFAVALEILRPTLPYYIALTKYGLLRITKDSFEFDPHPTAPPMALEMAKAVFTMGASSCTESFVMSRTLAEGPKLFAFDALTCEALENFDLSVSTADYLQPFPSVVVELPQDYAGKRVVPFEEGRHAPDFVIVRHEPEAGCMLVTMHLTSGQELTREYKSKGLTMTPDWDTNHLFLSDRLEADEPALFTSLRSVLKDVPIDIVPGTSDIWCRDYMPVQLDENTFCQFVYAPDYLRGFKHLVTIPKKCRLPFMTSYRQEPLVLDGGNVVASRTKVILTDKVYKENPTVARLRLRQRLEEVFQAECIFIPKEPYDKVGHSDGVVRFVTEDRVLINDYSGVNPSYGERLQSLLEKNGLEVDTLPLFEEKGRRRRRDDLRSAVGLYINYLRVGDVVVMPGYGRPEDQVTVDRMQRALPNAVVWQVECRSLAEKGGVLNCVSWAIKDKTIRQE
jgi:agmatine deiminase